MANQSDIAGALQRAGVSVYGLQVQGTQVSGTVGTGEERVKAVSAIQQSMPDAQVNIQVQGGFADMAQNGGGKTYTIQAGDNLRTIARHALGDEMRWKEIWEANKDQIPNPDVIRAGATIKLPG